MSNNHFHSSYGSTARCAQTVGHGAICHVEALPRLALEKRKADQWGDQWEGKWEGKWEDQWDGQRRAPS